MRRGGSSSAPHTPVKRALLGDGEVPLSLPIRTVKPDQGQRVHVTLGQTANRQAGATDPPQERDGRASTALETEPVEHPALVQRGHLCGQPGLSGIGFGCTGGHEVQGLGLCQGGVGNRAVYRVHAKHLSDVM